MSDVKKLQRGLSDISSLFEKKREIVCPDPLVRETIYPRLQGISCVSLWDASQTCLSSSVIRWLAYQLSGMKIPTRVLGVPSSDEREGGLVQSRATPLDQEYLQFVALSPSQWETIEAQSVQWITCPSYEGIPEALFLDFPFDSFAVPPILYSILDRLILITDESSQSLESCYRLIKRIQRSASPVELGLVFKGMQINSAGERLYERFSGLVSKHLGADLNWMGYLDYYQEARIPCLQFSALQVVQGFSRNPGREKLKGEFLRSLRITLGDMAWPEVHQQGA